MANPSSTSTVHPFGDVQFEGSILGFPVQIIRERIGSRQFIVYVANRFEGAEWTLAAAKDRASSVAYSLAGRR